MQVLADIQDHQLYVRIRHHLLVVVHRSHKGFKYNEEEQKWLEEQTSLKASVGTGYSMLQARAACCCHACPAGPFGACCLPRSWLRVAQAVGCWKSCRAWCCHVQACAHARTRAHVPACSARAAIIR